MDNPRYRYEYDPEKAYDFVTGEDGPKPRPKACYFPDRPIFPRLEATFDGDRPKLSLWERFLDWWVNG